MNVQNHFIGVIAARFIKRFFTPKSSLNSQGAFSVIINHQPSSGFILIAVLWVSMLLSIFALNYATTSRIGAVRVQTVERLAEQSRLLRSALAVAEHKVRTYKANREMLEEIAESPEESSRLEALDYLFYPRHEPYDVEVDGQTVQVRVVSDGARWNVNTISPTILENILAVCGVEFGARMTSLVNSIQDWIDEDDLRRMEGAESPYYLGLEHPYPAKNGPLESIEELLLIRGIDHDLFWGAGDRPGLVDFLTVSGQTEKLDINSVSARALALVPNIRTETIEGILQFRQEGRVKSMSDLALVVDARDYELLLQYFDVLPAGSITLEARLLDPETGRVGRVLKKALTNGANG